MTDYNFFNDPCWMDFECPPETFTPVKKHERDPITRPLTKNDVQALSTAIKEDRSMYSSGAPGTSSSIQPLNCGYRRTNRSNIYQQQSSAIPINPRRQYWNQTNWHDNHLPINEGFSNSEFERQRSPPRGYQNSRFAQNVQNEYYNSYRYEHPSRSWRGCKRPKPQQNLVQVPRNIINSNYINSKHDDSNTINKDGYIEEARLGVDIKDLVTNLSYMNQRYVFEKKDGKKFHTKQINNNHNESDKDCLMETIPLLLNTSRKIKTALTSTQILPKSDTTEVAKDSGSSSFTKAQSSLAEIISASEINCCNTIENPPNKYKTILIDANALNANINSYDKSVSPNLKSKIEIKMDILLSPPKIVFNPNPLQIEVVDEGPFEDQNSELIICLSDDDDNVNQLKQSVDVTNKVVKDIVQSNLPENVKVEKNEHSESMKRKHRTSSCGDPVGGKCIKLDNTEEKAKLDSLSTSKNAQKQKKDYEMKTNVLMEGNVVKKQQAKEKLNKKVDGDKAKLASNKEKVQSIKKKHKSSNKKHCSSKEAELSVDRNKDSAGKRRQSCDETLVQKKNCIILIQRRNSCVGKSTTDVQKTSEILVADSLKTTLNNDSSKQKLKESDNTLTAIPYVPFINDYDDIDANSKRTMLETQIVSLDLSDTLMCDNEIDQISSQIRHERNETDKSFSTHKRSKSASIIRSSPVKISKRRRTIFDASELTTPIQDEKPKRGRRRNRRNRDDPSFTANVVQTNTPCRITRSKSREMIARAFVDSTDAVVPKFPDDPDFYERSTPPATERHAESSEILPSLIVTSDDSSLSNNEESQVMNYAYAPSFGTCDLGISPLLKDEQQEVDDTLVDKITLHNTMANKVTPPSDSSSAQIVLNMLTDDDIRSLQTDIANVDKENTSKPETITLYSNQERNKVACSISITSTALSELMGTSNNTNVDIEKILKDMDAAPRLTKEPTPKVRKLMDPCNNNVTIDNTITMPLLNKHNRQTCAPKQFNPYAKVSANNDQSSDRLPTKYDNSSKEQLKRLFEVEAKQIYPLNHSGKDKELKVSKKSNKKGPTTKNNTSKKTQKKSTKTVTKSFPLLRHHTNESILPFVEEETILILDLFYVSQEATTLIQCNTNFEEANILTFVISTSETIKSIPEISEDDIFNLDDIFHDNLSINGESSLGNVKGETISSVVKLYDKPTVVATIDLYAKPNEDDCEMKTIDLITPCQLSSILIVSVTEYVLNVSSVIGQYIQMEKLHLRTQDMVKKSTTSFALKTIDCDDIVQEFKKLYTVKLGGNFVDYTDSIEIQNFSVTVLYTALTEASLRYNGMKIKKYDVAKTICDFYDAVGNQHLRSVFCNQLYQLSAHVKEMEFTADNERSQIQQHPSPNPSPVSRDVLQSPQSTLNSSPSISPLNPTTSPFIPITTNPAIENITPPPLIPITIRTSPKINTPEIGSPTATIASAVIQNTFEPILLSNIESVSKSQETQSLNSPGNVEFRHAAQDAVVLNQQPLVASITSHHVPSLPHTVILNQPMLPVQNQNKRRIKYTSPINQQNLTELLSPSSDLGQRLFQQINTHNLLVTNYHAIVKISTSSPSCVAINYKQTSATTNKSGVAVASTLVPSPTINFAMPTNCSTAKTQQGSDLRSLRICKSNVTNRPNKNSPCNKPETSLKSIQSPIAPSSASPLSESNTKISVRSINLLQQSSPGELHTAKPQNMRKVSDGNVKEKLAIAGISSISIGNESLPSQSLNGNQLMVGVIVDNAIQSCITESNNATKGDSARVCSFSKGDSSSPQTHQDPVMRNLSRDSGNSSVDAFVELEDVDISCICGQMADKICSCKLIVYCSEICQRNDWTRHSVEHVDS